VFYINRRTRTLRSTAATALCAALVATGAMAASPKLQTIAVIPPVAGDLTLATGPIIDLDFRSISGSTVPDRSGNGNDGAGKQGAIGFESSWSPSTVADSQGDAAVIFDGTQMERIEIPNRSGSLDVNPFSILVQLTLDESVDTDPLHQRYELMEKAGSFWFNVREDTTPKYLLRTGGYFNGKAHALTGVRVIPNMTLTWAIATYDGAHLTTYVANGDGTNLVLDNSVAQTGTVATGATITGIDENLVVGAKHRKGHFVDGTGGEILEGMFNGTMSRFIVFNTALTQTEIASVISGSVPIVTPKVTGKLGTNGWYTSATTTLTWTVTGSPTPITSGCGTVSVPQTTGKTYTCSATNSLGSASKSVMIKMDSIKPQVTVSVPAKTKTYKLHQTVLASYSCQDVGSRIATCAGTVKNGTAINTSAKGTKTFAVVGTDKAGNKKTVSVLYNVT
jgi:hypothetical protein